MESEIQKVLDRIDLAYQRKDAKELAALYHPNAKYPLPTGGVAVGPGEIEEHLPAIFALVPEDIESEMISRQIDLVTEQVAIVDLRIENFRKAAGGRESVSIEGFTLVVVLEGTQWFVAGMRGALVPKG